MTSRQRLVLRAFAIWTIWVWATRIWNILGDARRSTGFKTVHAMLALVSVAFAVATLVIVSKVSGPRPPGQAEEDSREAVVGG